MGEKLEVISLPTKKNKNKAPARVSTETIQYRSHSLNYGKLTPIELYVVWCPQCGKECKTTNIIDGEETNGTIQKQDAIVCLHSAICKLCNWEHFF